MLYKYFDGKCNSRQKKEVLDWLDLDPEHRKILLAERHIFDTVIMCADPAKVARRRSLMRRMGRTAVRYAAVIALTMASVTAYYTTRDDSGIMGANAISVPAGQRVEMTLPDGTRVFVNALSKLEYPAVFDKGSRRVKLTGEAFFEVTHDSGNPFVVETFACDVEVLGTTFNVEAYPESGKFLASLVSGKVKVTDHASHNSVVLRPNQQALCIGGRMTVAESPEEEDFLWRNGILAYKDASFSDMIAGFNKYFGIKFVVERTMPTTKYFTGKIRISDGVDHALWVLQRSDNFTYRWNETRDIIYIR